MKERARFGARRLSGEGFSLSASSGTCTKGRRPPQKIKHPPNGRDGSIVREGLPITQLVVLLLNRDEAETGFLGGESHRNGRRGIAAPDRARDASVVASDIRNAATACAQEPIEQRPCRRALRPVQRNRARARDAAERVRIEP